MNQKELLGVAVSYLALQHLIVKQSFDNHLKLEILSELNKSKDYSLFRQELVKKLSIKHYKNFHMALKKLEDHKMITQEKQYREHSQPIKVILNKKRFDVFMSSCGLEELFIKHKIKVVYNKNIDEKDMVEVLLNEEHKLN